MVKQRDQAVILIAIGVMSLFLTVGQFYIGGKQAGIFSQFAIGSADALPSSSDFSVSSDGQSGLLLNSIIQPSSSNCDKLGYAKCYESSQSYSNGITLSSTIRSTHTANLDVEKNCEMWDGSVQKCVSEPVDIDYMGEGDTNARDLQTRTYFSNNEKVNWSKCSEGGCNYAETFDTEGTVNLFGKTPEGQDSTIICWTRADNPDGSWAWKGSATSWSFNSPVYSVAIPQGEAGVDYEENTLVCDQAMNCNHKEIVEIEPPVIDLPDPTEIIDIIMGERYTVGYGNDLSQCELDLPDWLAREIEGELVVELACVRSGGQYVIHGYYLETPEDEVPSPPPVDPTEDERPPIEDSIIEKHGLKIGIVGGVAVALIIAMALSKPKRRR